MFQVDGIFSVQICKVFIPPDHTFLPTQEINLGTLERPFQNKVAGASTKNSTRASRMRKNKKKISQIRRYINNNILLLLYNISLLVPLVQSLTMYIALILTLLIFQGQLDEHLLSVDYEISMLNNII